MLKFNARLSFLSIKSTSTILRGDALKLSPALGLIAATPPQFLANWRGAPMTDSAHQLCKELFHQRSFPCSEIIGNSPRRYGPVVATKSRSKAAYWLHPSTIGTLLGISYTTDPSDKVIIRCFCNFALCICINIIIYMSCTGIQR